MEEPSYHRSETTNQMINGDDEDHISKLPDEVFVRILSLLGHYKDTVKTVLVSRRWERAVHTQLPNLHFSLPLRGVQSIERTLRRRCAQGNHSVNTLGLMYSRDVPLECRHADEFITIANARKLLLYVDGKLRFRSAEEEVGATGPWDLRLPPPTTELHVLPSWYTVTPPRIVRSPGANNLRSLTLDGSTVLRQYFLLTYLPSLEDLRIVECSIDGSILITSDTMPRLRHLELTDVGVMTNNTRAEIHVLVDELRTLRVSCYKCSSTTKPTKSELEKFSFGSFVAGSRFVASFTTYSSFRLRAPRLRVFDWRCCYADDVCIESVGNLSSVVVEIAAGLKKKQYGDHTYVTVNQRDKLMKNVLRGLMPGLQPLDWEDVKRKCVERDDNRWICFEITNA